MKMDESANYCEEILEKLDALEQLIKDRPVRSCTPDRLIEELIDMRFLVRLTTGKLSFSNMIESSVRISRDLLIEEWKMNEFTNYREEILEVLDAMEELIKEYRRVEETRSQKSIKAIPCVFRFLLKKISLRDKIGSPGKISRDLLIEERKMDESANYCEKRWERKWIELTEEGPRVKWISGMGGSGKTTETCLHVADNFDLHLLVLDYKGKIAFTSTKQFQTSTELPPLNSGGFVVMDISYDLPYLDNVDISIHGIVQEPRAMITWDLTKQKIKHPGDHSQRELFNGSRDLPEEKIKHNNDCSHRGLSNDSRDFTIQIIKPNDDYSHRGLSNGASDISIVGPSVGTRIVFLLIATLIAATTCQVPFHFLGSSSSKERPDQFKIMCTLFILCNSMVFIASVGVITFLLHEFPLKPWPHISISALFGSYMLSLNAIMPNGAPALFFISIPILLIGICRETLWLCKSKTYLSTSSLGRNVWCFKLSYMC